MSEERGPAGWQSRLLTTLLSARGAARLFACIFIAWASSGIVVLSLGLWLGSSSPHGLINPGVLGDMFGAVNALFAGLAFGGVVVALLLQVQDRRDAREASRQDLKAQREISEAQRAVARAGAAFGTWQDMASSDCTKAISDVTELHRLISSVPSHQLAAFEGSLIQFFESADRVMRSGVDLVGLSRAALIMPKDAITNALSRDEIFFQLNVCSHAIMQVRASITAGVYSYNDLAEYVSPNVCLLLAHHFRCLHEDVKARVLRSMAKRLQGLELDAHEGTSKDLHDLSRDLQRRESFYSDLRRTNPDAWKKEVNEIVTWNAWGDECATRKALDGL